MELYDPERPLPPKRVAFVLDGVIQDILHTDERLASILLSEPLMVDVSDEPESVVPGTLYPFERNEAQPTFYSSLRDNPRMRGNKVQGRFKIDFESKSMDEGMVDDLRDPVGTTVSWWVWDQAYLDANPNLVVDDIYDVSSTTPGEGRRWKSPFELPVIMAQQIRSSNVMNERGFYVTDTLRLVVSVSDVNILIPDMITNPTTHIKDRIAFQEKIFVPTRVMPRGRYKERYSVVTIDCNQVNAEELVNDPQFQSYASPSVGFGNGVLGYGVGLYGSYGYGR